ncbi:MAG: hypothetical protein AB8U25_05720 [Rickettsiales endosymbiont of Dermacentor nuttalli]
MKLDSIQYLIINLIERIKDPIHNVSPVLTKAREILVKDFYVIDDRNININLEQLENFSKLLISYADNINNLNNNIAIDFASDKFVQHIQQFINHRLPLNLQDRNKFYIKALETSLTKLQKYNDANSNINNFKNATSYYTGRIREILYQLINDDFHKIRNSVFHEHIVNNNTYLYLLQKLLSFIRE